MIQRLLLVSLSVVVGFGLGANVVMAQETTEVRSFNDDARSARLRAIEAINPINIDQRDMERIASRCQGAQGRLLALKNRINSIKSKRQKDYADITTILNQLKAALQKTQIDTSNLDLLIISYIQKSQSFTENIDRYELALSDAIVIDCTSDPKSFRIALEGARIARKDLVTVTSSIDETTKSTMKTVLDSFKIRLRSGGDN